MSSNTTNNYNGSAGSGLLRDLVGDDFFFEVIQYERDCRAANVAAFAGGDRMNDEPQLENEA